jgi:CRISPR-associated protein Cas2
VAKKMVGFGDRLQYSVFICDLDVGEKLRMKGALGKVIDHHRDSVVLVDLGDPDGRGARCFEFLGTTRALPQSGARIV